MANVRLVTNLNDKSKAAPPQDAPAQRRAAAAERALAEAAARREQERPAPPREINGRQGPEPTRYGDWEIRGLASDF
jgi:hypothetical protein